jgi:glycosyltransferase involved in cell wall biosynthesis
MNEHDLPLVLHTRVVTGAGGGPEKTILNSPRFLPPLGYRSICAYMRPPRDAGFEVLRRRAQQWQAPLVEIDDRGPFDTTLFQAYVDLCRRERVAIWHGHDYKSNLVGLWVNRYWPMKLVTTVHGWVKFTWRTPLYYAVDRFCLRRYERVICVSDDLEAACLRAGVRRDKCVWIDNAIDTNEFARGRSCREAKQALGFDPERVLIGAVGRLSEEKGFDLLIQAVAELHRQGTNVTLAIVGDGDQRDTLERLIEQYQLTQHAQLLGFRDDTKALYEAFDIFALSSHREGLPNVVLEAMAMETPVVATAVNGVPKLVTHEHDGLLVPAADPGALRQALERLVVDPNLRAQLALSGRRTIEQRFSFQRRMEKVASVYDSLFHGEHV